jgi:hypothetical protein
LLLVSYGFFGEAVRLMKRYSIATTALDQWISNIQYSAGAWRWRFQLVKSAIRCFFQPEFRNRLVLARLCTQLWHGKVGFRFTGVGKV